jgi:hypothetical protein
MYFGDREGDKKFQTQLPSKILKIFKLTGMGWA